MKKPKIMRKIKNIVREHLALGPPPESHIESVDNNKGVIIIRLKGSITAETLQDVRNEFSLKTRDKEIKNILFDLKDVSETDTSGIAALIDLFRVMKTSQRGDRIGLINVPKKIKNLFVISKAKEFFKEYSSEEKAIKVLE